VIIKGEGFLEPSSVVVRFGLAQATGVTVIDSETISCTTPAWIPDLSPSPSPPPPVMGMLNGTEGGPPAQFSKISGTCDGFFSGELGVKFFLVGVTYPFFFRILVFPEVGKFGT
jgi:hypothetical protein